jgi:MFS superfamily sulfate permease-like transporter
VWAAALIGLTLVLLAPYLDQLPIPVLAGIIVASAVRLIALQDIYALWPGHKTELVVAVSAALGVIMAGVLAGVGIALAISLLAFVRRAANPHCAVLGRRAGRAGWFDTERYPEARQEPGVLVFRFDGPLFFASAEAFHTHLLGAIDAATPAVRRVVVHAPAISSIDVTASEMLRDLILEMDARGIDVVVSGARGLLRDQLRNGGVVPDDRLYKTVEEALAGDATE